MAPSRTKLGRWLGGPRRAGGHAVGWLTHAPRWLQAALAVGFLAVLGVGGYAGYDRQVRGRHARAVGQGWARFEQAVKAGDDAKAGQALEAVLALEPESPLARQRLDGLNAGDANPDDPALIALTMSRQWRGGDLPAAAREADKWLRHNPQDWFAHCVKAADALKRGDAAEANRRFDALPSPTSDRAQVNVAGLLLAFQLARDLGRDAAPLRNYVRSGIVPLLKGPRFQDVPSAQKLAIVECYLEGFEPATDAPQPPALAEAWAAVRKLVGQALDQAAEGQDAPALARVGRLGPRLDAALRAFHQGGQVSDQQRDDYRRENEERTRRAWSLAKPLLPQSSEPYRGLAESLIRAKEFAAAREELVRGVHACGEDPELARYWSRFLQAEGRAAEAYRDLEAAARRHPEQPAWWALAADAADAAGRRDLAILACEELRKRNADSPWAARTEARHYLEAGDAARAVELLRPQGAAELARDPDSARLYTRALAAAGLHAQIEPFLAAAQEAGERTTSAAPMSAALQGWLAADPRPEALQKVADRADRLLNRHRDSLDLLRVRADALARLAERSTPPWEATRVVAAVQAAERLRARAGGDRDLAVMLVRLRLFGQNDPAQAYRDAAPLRDAEKEGTLTPTQREHLGLAYRVAGHPAEAIRAYQPLTRLADAPAGAFTQLALAYHANRQPAEARAALEGARSRPRTEREQADYVQAADTLLREKP